MQKKHVWNEIQLEKVWIKIYKMKQILVMTMNLQFISLEASTADHLSIPRYTLITLILTRHITKQYSKVVKKIYWMTPNIFTIIFTKFSELRKKTSSYLDAAWAPALPPTSVQLEIQAHCSSCLVLSLFSQSRKTRQGNS